MTPSTLTERAKEGSGILRGACPERSRRAQDDKGSGDDKRSGKDHVVGVEWVPISELAERIVVGVVREPLLAYLGGALPQCYAGFHDAGVTIEWPAGSD